MKKIEKFVLTKNVVPSDMLKKKQMGKYWGGKNVCCNWFCTVDASGTWHPDLWGQNYSVAECWEEVEEICVANGYGAWIQSDC